MTPIQKTRNKLARFYGVGILAFVAFFGFISLLVVFLANINLG